MSVGFEAAWRQALLSDPDFGPFVGATFDGSIWNGNFYRDRKPSDAECGQNNILAPVDGGKPPGSFYPLVVFFRISGEQEEAHDGVTDCRERRYQLDTQSVFSATEAEAVAQALVVAIRKLNNTRIPSPDGFSCQVFHSMITENGSAYSSELEIYIDSRDSLTRYGD